MKSSLVTRNVRIHRRRTSVRLEPQLWRALELIADRESTDINTICSRVADKPRDGGGFTSALRVYIVRYFAALALGDRNALESSFDEDADDREIERRMSA